MLSLSKHEESKSTVQSSPFDKLGVRTSLDCHANGAKEKGA